MNSQSTDSVLSTVTTTVTTTTKIFNPIAASLSCPLCKHNYQMTCHRPIGELACGHLICYQCFVLNTNQFGCFQCKSNSPKSDAQIKEETDNFLEQRIRTVFHQVFQLSEFRQNQFEAIQAALQHHDCFILMPTGGGKSLCYQLPAIIDTGVTFVIAPLRSLIFDQKQRLNLLNIPSVALTGNISTEESDEIYRNLYKDTPTYKIVFITPEKIMMSDQLNNIFRDLYNRKLLARFIIDECHCVSEWGHDFRRDYSQLGQLRLNYPNVNITLLTATATTRVQQDILEQLHINTNYKLFTQSFNRSNLIYECLLKENTDSTLNQITNLIKTNYEQQSGIIYCFSRAECDRTAQYLLANNIHALSYHAGLNDSLRQTIHMRWINDECQVICATVAFGMGIDKNNVRFVIHFSIPQSIEGYYQESGRAGRDGQIANCHLFFCYDDYLKMKRLILNDDESRSPFQSKQIRINNINRVYDYCLNNVICRRTQLLEYFGEIFPSSECKRILSTECDNCRQNFETSSIDCTRMSIEILKLVSDINQINLTLPYLIDILHGTDNKTIRDAGHHRLQAFNSCHHLTRLDIERLISRLIIEGYLKQEFLEQTSTIAYLRPGVNAVQLTTTSNSQQRSSNRNQIQIELIIRVDISKQKSFEHINEQCLNELKTELRNIFHTSNYSNLISEETIQQLVELMPRSKEKMLKQMREINENLYKQYDFNRLLRILQRFGSQRDEIRRMDSSDNDDQINLSVDFIDHRKRPIITTTITKRKRAND